MAIELGTCTRLRARISMEQCKNNRKGTPGAAACFACDGCPGLENIAPIDYQPADQHSTAQHDQNTLNHVLPKETIMSEKTGTCPTCKREGGKLTGTKKGNCFRGYDRIRKSRDPLTGKPNEAQADGTPPVPPPPRWAGTDCKTCQRQYVCTSGGSLHHPAVYRSRHGGMARTTGRGYAEKAPTPRSGHICARVTFTAQGALAVGN